jgi:two-component system, OmpR family, sensor histidine kinase MtrB
MLPTRAISQRFAALVTSSLSETAGTPGRRFRLGLRARTAAALAIAALLVSVAVSAVTYGLARKILLDARKTSFIRQVVADAETVQIRYSQPGGASQKDLLDNLARSESTSVFLSTPEGPRTSPQTASIAWLSQRSQLIDQVYKGTPAAQQLFRSGPTPYFGVGVRLPAIDSSYFEVENLADLSSSLTNLARALAFAAGLTTIAAALIGRALARRVVRPLREVANAAVEISTGKLDTRLPPSSDVDLAPLLGSFNEMAASLQGRLEREARFASDVSHELRTPLTALSTAAQLLKGRRDEMPERAQTALDVLVTQTDQFERLVLDLLEISRYDAGAVELHPEEFDLPELVRQVAHVNEIDVPVDSSHLASRIVALDKRRMERILANLLQNARNYGGGATGVALADMRLPDGSAGVRIEVCDGGPGVPEEDRERIFERFFRGKGQRVGSGSKGTGLGLSLVAAHARLHGGRVWVEENPGGGSKFVVEVAVAS